MRTTDVETLEGRTAASDTGHEPQPEAPGVPTRSMNTRRRQSRISDLDLLLGVAVALAAVTLAWGLGVAGMSWALLVVLGVALVVSYMDLLGFLIRYDPFPVHALIWGAASAAMAGWLLYGGRYLTLLAFLAAPPWLAFAILFYQRGRILYLRWAARQGHPSAQYRLAERYYYGDGVPEDTQQAVHWYQTAALQRYRRAERKLARLYERGDGVPRDARLADEWRRRTTARKTSGRGGEAS
jgi:hypothetical protein